MNGRNYKVVVLDSYAGKPCKKYLDTFSNVTFYSYEPHELRGVKVHGHGGWVASLICQQVPEDKNISVYFVRIFNDKGGFGLDDEGMARAMQYVKGVKPDYICCSWGMADGDNALQELTQRLMFDDNWIALWSDSIGHADVFWAAGNDDNNDADPDIDAPQKYMVYDTNQHIVGADRFNGVPCVFSGDGEGVDVMYPGEDTYSLDADSGKWVKWSGTSAAAPSAIGDIIANGVGHGVSVKRYWELTASRATRYLGMTERHNKAGWGSMNYSFENNILRTKRWPTLLSKISSSMKSAVKSW